MARILHNEHVWCLGARVFYVLFGFHSFSFWRVPPYMYLSHVLIKASAEREPLYNFCLTLSICFTAVRGEMCLPTWGNSSARIRRSWPYMNPGLYQSNHNWSSTYIASHGWSGLFGCGSHLWQVVVFAFFISSFYIITAFLFTYPPTLSLNSSSVGFVWLQKTKQIEPLGFPWSTLFAVLL